MPDNKNDMNDFELFRYTPNRSAARFFAVMFSILIVVTIPIIVLLSMKSKRKIHTLRQNLPADLTNSIRNYTNIQLLGAYFPLFFGLLLEIIGYIGRSISCLHPEDIGPYICQSVCLLIAPTLYTATVYMLFGRMGFLLHAENLMLMPAKWNTTLFVMSDVLSLFLQSAGGGLMASQGSATTGSNLVTAGLFIQIGFFVLFIFNECLFVFRIRKIDNPIATHTQTWKRLNIVLILNCMLILIRSVVRAVEFVQGYKGIIISNEWFLYVFDAVPMFCLPLIFLASINFTSIFQVHEESLTIQSNYQFYGNQNKQEDTVSAVDSTIIEQDVSSLKYYYES